jgi:hypothetical protein
MSRMTMKVSMITSSAVEFPKEYEVALYENLYNHLSRGTGLAGVYRDGDASRAASCPEYDLKLTVNVFHKGNAVLRTSAGLIGNVFGAT